MRGRSWPSDYKQLLDVYGPFRPDFVELFFPVRPEYRCDLLTMTRQLQRVLMVEEFPQPSAEVLALPLGW